MALKKSSYNMSDKFVSGFITIIGRPNVGKSTFINRVLGQKIAIMSDKPQTTRNKIQGIHTTSSSQMIFIDTPGVHKPKHELGRTLTNNAINAIKGVDAILFMVPANEKLGPGDLFIIEQLKNSKLPVFLVINKIDTLRDKGILSDKIEEYKEHLKIERVFKISALNGDNVIEMLDALEEYLPEGPMYFPSDQITDHPERFIISEIIREKILFLTRDEVPHSVAVIIESMKKPNENENLVEISATIIVERDSQKGIVIGKGGLMLKEVGTKARVEIKDLLGTPVFLELFVKVKKDWRNKKMDLKNFGITNE